MAISEYASISSLSISTTELSIISGTSSLQTLTDNGVYSLWLDPTGASLAKGDYFKVRVYEKVEATGGTKRVVWSTVIGNAQLKNWVFPPLMLKNGWDMTLQKLAGTDRLWDASIRGVACTIGEPYELDGVTVGATELSIVSGTTTLQSITDDGVYQVFVDPIQAGNPMAKGDYFRLRIYEKVIAAGVQRPVFELPWMDVQMENGVSPMLTMMHGWDATLIKFTGTDRAFDASIRRVV